MTVMATREEQAADDRTDGDAPRSAEPPAHRRRDGDGGLDVEADADAAAAGTVPAVAVSGMSKRFVTGADAVTAVDHVSDEIRPGSILVLLRPTGA